MLSRRHFLRTALPAFGLLCICGAPLMAESLDEKVARALRRQGYRDIKTSRTFLGRLRVTAQKGKRTREVVLNRRTGEVLRDVITERGKTDSVFDDYDGQERSSPGDSESTSGQDGSDDGSDNDKGGDSRGHDGGGDDSDGDGSGGGDSGGDDD